MAEQYFYSPERGSFYPLSWRQSYEESPDGWPVDAVSVAYDDYVALLNGRSAGKRIIPGNNNYPVLAEPLPPSHEQLVMWAESEKRELMANANNEVSVLQDVVELDDATEEEKRLLAAWKTYRVSLYRINTKKPQDIKWPETPK